MSSFYIFALLCTKIVGHFIFQAFERLDIVKTLREDNSIRDVIGTTYRMKAEIVVQLRLAQRGWKYPIRIRGIATSNVLVVNGEASGYQMPLMNCSTVETHFVDRLEPSDVAELPVTGMFPGLVFPSLHGLKLWERWNILADLASYWLAYFEGTKLPDIARLRHELPAGDFKEPIEDRSKDWAELCQYFWEGIIRN